MSKSSNHTLLNNNYRSNTQQNSYKDEHTTEFFFRSETRLNSFLSQTQLDEHLFKLFSGQTQPDLLIFSGQTHNQTFSGRTCKHIASQVEHMTKLFLGQTQPNSFSGQTHDQTSQVEHTSNVFLRLNSRPNPFSG